MKHGIFRGHAATLPHPYDGILPRRCGSTNPRHPSERWDLRRLDGRPGASFREIPAFAGMTVFMAGASVAVILLTFATPAAAAKLPPCPPPQAQLFVAPMGQPFRSPAGAADPVEAWFAQGDADRDGRITRAEFAADADRFFTTLDTDRDGELIPAEVSAYERNVAPEIRLYAPRAPGPMRAPTKQERKAAGEYGMPLGAGRWGFLNIPEPVAAADADLNRGVTRPEFAAAAADRFRQIDALQTGGKRGVLEAATLPKTPAQTAATACDPTRVAPPPKRPR